MNAAARGGGASIRPTLSTTWLSRSLASEARRLDAHIHGKLGSTLSPLTKKAHTIPRRPCCSLALAQSSIWRYGATPRKRTRSLKFLRQKQQRRGKWLVPCVQVLTLCNICKIIFKSSRQFLLPAVVCFAAQTARLAPTIVQDPGLQIRRRSRSQEDYAEMLAKKVKAWHRRRHVGPEIRLNVQGNFPEQRRAQAGPLAGHIAMHSLPYGSISVLLRKRATANSFTRASCYSWSSNWHTGTTCWQKNQERTTFPSTTSDRQRARVKRKNVCKSKAWRDGANLKAHIASRAFSREIPVRGRFFRTPFSTTFRWRIFLKPTGID